MSASQNSQLAIVSGNGRRSPSAESLFASPEAFEPLLDCEEAAALLRMHPRTLKRNARHPDPELPRRRVVFPGSSRAKPWPVPPYLHGTRVWNPAFSAPQSLLRAAR